MSEPEIATKAPESDALETDTPAAPETVVPTTVTSESEADPKLCDECTSDRPTRKSALILATLLCLVVLY